ncbi:MULTISPECIES: class I adenylate-forming enzyme family protein [Rhodococcus]|uniref:class I adenylate-forming enzyme family protein n=1 Tax=Rhodococcus TaxID=1827 RepID=UPI001E641FAA|nr:AMP-binding protein [Rhodococcus pyridinivorans]MCD2116034.1 AMP-binding protein [Rhodococcus pyridinivorans]MCZ4624898.1 AMP-binding protein [Rhodococcus pyridinivorans]MCZ4646108.1 AMP-binding protein [Rhodococcus pyridinivorans]MDJ0482830.1 AMP-binding protein [Rhodococcus pyridinivorans]MDV7251937.1 AMP-binding protein [Rhodococcus pyridinivorans]
MTDLSATAAVAFRGPFALLAVARTETPDAVALRTVDGTMFSYDRLWDRTVEVAAQLARLGVGPGERVVVRMSATPDAVAVAFAVWGLGATYVPLHPQLTDTQLEGIVEDCRPVLVVDGALTDPSDPLDPPHLVAHEPSALAALIYTSGSTAAPKGVRCPASAMEFGVHAIQQRLNYRADDTIALLSPLSFDYGLYQLLLAFSVGAQVVLADAARATEMLAVIRRIDVTVLPVVPPVAHMLYALLRRSGPACSVRMVTSTGADLSESRIAELREVLPCAAIVAMYGITECKRVTVAEPDLDRIRPGSVGRPLPGTAVTILDENGRPVEPGSVGQIVVSGPNVMDGYWEQPEMTTERFGRWPDGTAFLRTGDYGYVDDDGYLYFRGRRDDIFKTKGVRASVTEIAAAVERVPGIREVVVIPPRGDRELAVVVTGSVSASDVVDDLHRRLEPQKVPGLCVVVDRMPLTANGKIDTRRVIREFEENQ